ncbi:MAG: glycosyltransferase family 39 protein [Candidatus Woesebacteria bacterium]|jgi:4-amino-4-deoxy-L-arabinose transferase-like glycosyltransferase
MIKKPINELTLYRFRFVFAYILLAILTVGLLILNIQTTPAGLSAAEQASAVASSKINFNFGLQTIGPDILNFLKTTDVVDLPYHIIQKISLYFFGLNPLGVRLPSILLATSSAFMLFVLFKNWLRANTAVVMGIILATSSWFVGIGRIGTPEIMIIFWASLLVLLATLISQETRNRHLWKAFCLLGLALSLYTPYTPYLIMVGILATFLQPHLRYLLRYTEKTSVVIGVFLLLLVLIPLGFNLWREPGTIWQLFAIPSTLPGPIEFLRQILSSLSALINPFNINFGALPHPLIGVPTVALAAIGFVQLIKEWHSVRAHVLLIWLAILTPLMGLSTADNLAVLFVPVMMLCALGTQWMITYWYTIFPLNPYARVFGLLPLALLMASVISFNYSRYFLAMPYASETAALHNQDPTLLTDFISSKSNREQRITLIVADDKIDLYKIDQSVVKNLTVVARSQFASTRAQRVIIAEDEFKMLTPEQLAVLPTDSISLIVSDRKQDALRFRVYNAP